MYLAAPLGRPFSASNRSKRIFVRFSGTRISVLGKRKTRWSEWNSPGIWCHAVWCVLQQNLVWILWQGSGGSKGDGDNEQRIRFGYSRELRKYATKLFFCVPGKTLKTWDNHLQRQKNDSVFAAPVPGIRKELRLVHRDVTKQARFGGLFLSLQKFINVI